MAVWRVVTILIAGSALALSFWLASFLGAGAQLPIALPDLSKTDAAAAERLRAGAALEDEGRLRQAQSEYREALTADDIIIRTLAEHALERTRRKQTARLPRWLSVQWDDVLAVLTTGRFVFVVVIAIAFLDLVRRRRGIAIGLFPVYGTADAAAADAFRQYLFTALRDHQRVLGSRSFQLLGGVPSTDFLVLSPDAGDVLSRALEGAKSGELSSIVTFSLRELLQFVRSYRHRPAYSSRGTSTLRPRSNLRPG